MNYTSKYINGIWKKYINSFSNVTNNHIFLDDLSRISKSYSQPDPVDITGNLPEIDISDYFDDKTCLFTPKEKLPMELVDQVFDELTRYQSIPDWSKLRWRLGQYSDYVLPSNIDLRAYSKSLRNKHEDDINVLILGAGPAGLFIANYLNSARIISPRTNILIIDNRTDITNLNRMPYNRNRIFGLNLNIFSEFSPKFTCLKELLERGMIEIRYLENLLITMVYGFKIPIYFTNKITNENSLRKFVEKNKFDVVFDCTGGRFKNNFITDTIINFFNQNIIMENDLYKVEVVDNNAIMLWKNDSITDKFYLSIEIYDANGKFLQMPMWSRDIFYKHDLDFLYQFHDECLKIKKDRLIETVNLFDNLQDRNLSNDIKGTLYSYASENIRFYIIEAKLYHKLKISQIVHQNKHKFLYIATGDTIFSSHFIMGAGLNRILTFSKNMIWSLQFLNNIDYVYQHKYKKYKKKYLSAKKG